MRNSGRNSGGALIHFSHGTRGSAGVMICLSRRFSAVSKVKELYIDGAGRVQMLLVELENSIEFFTS